MTDKDSALWKVCDGDIEKVNGKTVFDAMLLDDETAKQVYKEYIEYVACGITNFINIFQPEVLSIGGGISKQGDILINPIKEIVEREQYSRFCDKKTIIKVAELQNDAGIIGAASLGK